MRQRSPEKYWGGLCSKTRIMSSKISAATLAAIALLVCAALAYAAGGGGHGEAHGGSLSPEKLKALLWRTLNFAALVAILVMALKKPLANGLGSRKMAIQQQFDELEARKAEAEQHYREYEAKLAKIDQEVQDIIATAVQQGEAEKEKILADATRAAADMKRQSEMAIQHALSEAKAQLRNEIAEEAVAMADELIRKNLQPADQDKMIEGYLDKVGGLK